MKINPKIKWGLGLGLSAVLAVNYNTNQVKDSGVTDVHSVNRSPQSAAPSPAAKSTPLVASTPSPTPQNSKPTLSLIDQTTLDLKGRADFIELVDVKLKRNGNQVERESLYRSSGPFPMIRVRHALGPQLSNGVQLLEETSVVGNRLTIDLKEKTDFEKVERKLASEKISYTVVRRMVTSPRVILDFDLKSIQELDRAAQVLESEEHVAAIHFDPILKVNE